MRKSPSIPSKCLSRLSKRAPCSMQLAAIHTSLIGMGLPLERKPRFISANHSDVESMIGTRRLRGFSRKASSLARFSLFREPPSKPSSSSPSTIGLKRISSPRSNSAAIRSSPAKRAEKAQVSMRTLTLTPSHRHRPLNSRLGLNQRLFFLLAPSNHRIPDNRFGTTPPREAQGKRRVTPSLDYFY